MIKKLLIITLLAAAGCAPVTVTCHKEYMSVKIRGIEGDRVQFFSSSYGYRPLEAKKMDSVWEVKTIFSNEFRYFLKVDGREALPNCEKREMDDYGGQLCIYEQVNICGK